MPMRLIKAIVVAGAPPSTEPLPPTREATLAGLGQGTRIVSGEWVGPGVLGLAAATDPSIKPGDAGLHARWTGGTRIARPIHGPRPSARRRAARASQFAPGEWVEPGVLGLAATTDPSKRPADAGLFDGLAGGPGFEPGLTESESVVLPLDDPPLIGDDSASCLAPRSRTHYANGSGREISRANQGASLASSGATIRS